MKLSELIHLEHVELPVELSDDLTRDKRVEFLYRGMACRLTARLGYASDWSINILLWVDGVQMYESCSDRSDMALFGEIVRKVSDLKRARQDRHRGAVFARLRSDGAA